jgi:putative PIN family toxin of toxin-antitoxin system
MSDAGIRVVFDCNTFAQALINPKGPAAGCVQRARDGTLALFVSPFVLAELRALHEKIPAKYGVTASDTDDLCRHILSFASLAADVPAVYIHPIDPDDSHYINLALHVGAQILVTRDRHLLNLMDVSRKEAQEFKARYPTIQVIDPVALLRELGGLQTP